MNILKTNIIFHVYIYVESYIVHFIDIIYSLTFMVYIKKSQ